jgi:hypothetical protein
MTRYGITEDYEYNLTHKRKRILLWSGGFMLDYEGDAFSLPKGNGFMINLGYGDKVRVECPVERTDASYEEQDKAINEALNRHRLEYLRSRIEAESISTYELIELQGLTEYIDSGDVQLLEWAGVPEFREDEEETYRPNGKRIL